MLLGPDFIGLAGNMSQMSMMIPILLVGLGVDYGIHLTMRNREEQAAGVAPADSGGRAIQAVGAALVLATITTVVGFLTNLANPLPPLQDFGIFAAAGAVSAFVVMTLFVPSVRLLADRRRQATGTPMEQTAHDSGPGALGRLAASMAPMAVRRPGVVLGVAAILAGAGGFGATQLSTEFSQTDFFPEGSRALETVEVVTESFGGSFNEVTNVLVEGDVTSADAMNAMLAFQGEVADVDGVRAADGRAQVDSIASRAMQAGLITGPVSDDAAAEAVVEQLVAADPTIGSVLADDGGAALLAVSTSTGENVDGLVDALDAAAAGTLGDAGLDRVRQREPARRRDPRSAPAARSAAWSSRCSRRC